MKDSLKDKIKSYSFWVSLASAILLLVQTVGKSLGLLIDESTYMSVVNSVLGIFVVLGIISHPSQTLLQQSNTDIDEIDETVKKGDTQKEQPTTVSLVVEHESGVGVIDSACSCDDDQAEVDVYANCDLNEKSKEKVEKAKKDFMNAGF